MTQKQQQNSNAEILLAGGCFWCVEAAMRSATGVQDVISGYATQGDHKDVSYQDVVHGRVMAREAILVFYDTSKTRLENVLEHFFTVIDPVDDGGQFHDRGFSYTTAIYVANDTERAVAEKVKERVQRALKKPVAAVIEPRQNFYPAEEYHQKYKEKNPDHYNQYYHGSGRAKYFKNNDMVQ